ncbi:putative ribonuclease H-like domain-containing protein, partial [Tanacetum coccineum]
MNGIKREFSVARTPQQNVVAERKNRTLIEAARTMLADSKLPTTFWAEVVNTACYVQNRVLVINPHNKTPYELFLGKKPALSFMRPFGCPVTILNTLDHLGQARKKIVPNLKYILLPLLTSDPSLSKSSRDSPNAGIKPLGEEEKIDVEHPENEDNEVPNTEEPRVNQEKDESINSTNNINTVSSTVNTASIEDNVVNENIIYGCIDDPNMPNLEEIVYSDDDEEVGAEADINNLATTVLVSPILTKRVHKDHPLKQIIGDIHSAPQTRRMTKSVTEHGLFSSGQQRINHKDFQNCLFACFLSQVEPKKVWTLMDLPHGKRAISTKWVFRNKKDDRGIMMDVKSAFLYGTIEEEVYVCQPPGFEDLEFPNKVYKVEKALYGLHQDPRAWYETLSTYLLENGFRRRTMDKTLFIKKDKGDILFVQVYVDDIIFGSTKKSLSIEFEQMMHKRFQMSSIRELTFLLGLQVKQKDKGIFISQDKYVANILKKFDFATMKTASTPMETDKALLKDEEDADVDVHLYKLMIGSLMYLTASRPDIIFAVCACARKAKRTTEISQSSRPIPLVSDENVIKEWEDIMERDVTTASEQCSTKSSLAAPMLNQQYKVTYVVHLLMFGFSKMTTLPSALQ